MVAITRTQLNKSSVDVLSLWEAECVILRIIAIILQVISSQEDSTC